MSSDRDEIIADLFHLAAELPPSHRAEFLDQRCAGDEAMRAEVEALLAADTDGQNASFLSPPARTPGPIANGSSKHIVADSPEYLLAAGTQIGRYRILQPIASGGMGTVYEATQEHPRRTIALKVIRAGQVSASIQRRFEYEAQVLGSLQHPGIAQVYEAGEHAASPTLRVAFIAMEYVAAARPLVEYAAATGLSLRDRIDLMARVCDAVQYAHQKGVIHRDLKPGNILVDASGHPKIIDFGVARAMNSDIAAVTQQTTAGQLIGTLRYMSPEQCEGDSNKIDTRSDVYSLGVVLYELLAGRLPYDLSSSSVVSVPRIICEMPPLKPSTVVESLRGDIETVVLKTLEKEPRHRYQSAGDIAADLRRWLANEPIHARQPSAVYQFRKFARRNRPLVAGVAVAVLALVAGTVGTTWQAFRATHQRDLARDAQIASDKDKAAAISEAETSRRITEFFEELLASADPETAQGKAITVHELVDRASADIGNSLSDQPKVEAGVRAALGKTYIGLGDYPKAEAHLVEAIRLRNELLGPNAPPTLEVRSNLATIYWMQGRLDDAVPIVREVLRGTEAHFGASSIEYFVAVDNLATTLSGRGEFAEAIELNRVALEGNRKLFGEEDYRTIRSQSNLAFKLDSTGRSKDAEPLFRKVVASNRKSLGNDHPDTVTSIVNHANCLRVLGTLDEAESLTREALEIRRRIYPANHPLTGDCCQLLGRILVKREDPEGALPFLTEALDNHRVSLPSGSWRTGVSTVWVGMALTKMKRYEEAEKHLLEGHEVLQRTKGQHKSQENGTITALVELYQNWGKPDQAAKFKALLPPAP